MSFDEINSRFISEFTLINQCYETICKELSINLEGQTRSFYLFAPIIRSMEGKKRPKKIFDSFKTTTRGVLDLSDWLTSYEVTHISMESTGGYWKCVWRILQNPFDLQLRSV